MYSGRAEDGKQFTFGTSGLLYRSNKLMFDRQTFSLWHNLTGEPVAGKLARSGLHLKILPMTFTTWREWRSLHPATTVLKLDAQLGARWGFRYEPGAADRAREGVSFPIWAKNNALPRNEEIYALRIGEKAKAYPIRSVLRDRVIHDRFADEDLVVIGDPSSGAVRIYKSGGHRFRPSNPLELVDESGKVWKVEEEAIVSETGARLQRLAGHLSWWFAWYGFFPQTEIYN